MVTDIDNSRTTYFSTDLSVADYVLPMNKALDELCQARGYKPGGKYRVESKAELIHLIAAIGASPMQRFAGGSAANMLVTIKLLGRSLVNCSFLGIQDNSNDSAIVQERFRHSGVEFIDVLPPAEIEPEIATSIAIKCEGGERILITYAGNAKDILKPADYTPERVNDCDVVVLQGSISAKFDQDRLRLNEERREGLREPTIFDEILRHRWDAGKWLVLAYPTSAFRPEFFEKLSKSADMILSNTIELGYVFKTGVKEAEDVQEVFTKIFERKENKGIITQKDIDKATEAQLPHVGVALESIKQRDGIITDLDLDECEQIRLGAVISAVRQLTAQQKESDEILQKLNREMAEKGIKAKRHGKQIAMITDGKHGAYVVTSDGYFHVPAHEKKKIVNTLGAGDTSFAAFVFAIIELGFTPKAAAEFAMALAATKIAHDGATLEGDGLAALEEINPRIATKAGTALEGRQKANSRG